MTSAAIEALHPDIRKFWEKQGYSRFRKSGVHNRYIVADKNNKIARIIGYDMDGVIYYYLVEGGNYYTCDEMLRLINLKAFI